MLPLWELPHDMNKDAYCFTLGAFFWDYSGIGILGMDGICVLMGALPFSE